MAGIQKQIIDLSHVISPEMPHWPGDLRTRIQQVEYDGSSGYKLHNLHIGEHSGTHIGAPSHFGSNAPTVDAIPVERLIVCAVKINLRSPASLDPDLLLQPGHLTEWQARNGEFKDCLVLIETGWDRYWNDRTRYFGLRHGKMHFPGVSMPAADMLVKRNKIIGLGIDTAGIDGGMSNDFMANRFLAQHQVYHVENLCHLSMLPERGFTVFIGALAIRNGHGSPCRIMAMVE